MGLRRKRRGLLVLVAAMILIPTAPALAEERPELSIEGGGWGHGIGMSQWGAKGQADAGRSSTEILEYYYTGTEVGHIADTIDPDSFLLTDSTPLYIGLMQDRTVVRFSAQDAVVKVCQQRLACKRTARPGEIWELRVMENGKCRFYRQRPGEPEMTTVGPAANCSASIKPRPGSKARMVLHGLNGDADEFAYGKIRFRKTSDRTLNVSLEIGMEDYLYGIAEALLYWPDAALETQAIAARSYAAQKALAYGPEIDFTRERKDDCWCHLYATTWDQRYKGFDNEFGIGGENWRRAVDNTAGQVVTYDGGYTVQGIASTFYSSSTGGATENVEDMWNGSAVPYLRSVPDPWSIDPDTGNPRASWLKSFQEWSLAGLLGLHQVDGVEVVERFVSGTPSRVDFHGRINGEPVVIEKAGNELRSILSLHSGQIRTVDIGPGTLWGGDFAGDGTTRPAVRLHFNNAWWADNGAGTSIETASVANFTNVSSEDYVVGDFDGDGIEEPARFNYANGRWMVAASGSGSAIAVWATMDQGSWTQPVAADVDRDGDSDVAVFDTSSGTWQVLISDGSGFAEAAPWYSFEAPTTLDFVRVGDFNNDRRADISMIDAITGTNVVLFSNGEQLVYRAWSSVPSTVGLSEVVIGDLNADGRSDWAGFEPSSGSWWVTIAPEIGRKADPAVEWAAYAGVGDGWLYHGAIDIDADGADELVGYRTVTGSVMVAQPTETGFAIDRWFRVPTETPVTEMIGGDVDGDGDADLIGYDDASRVWTILESDAQGALTLIAAGSLL